MPGRSHLYLDSSAIVKLAKGEAESAEARIFVFGARLTSSELVMTEVPRAMRRAMAENPGSQSVRDLKRGEILLEEFTLHPIERVGLRRAGRIFEPHLGSLDAIHVITAISLRPIDAFMTYDKRQAAAARRAGLPTVSPGA